MTSKRETDELRDYLARNVKGLITPANSGMAIALALFELADAQRAHTEQMRVLGNEALSLYRASPEDGESE